MSEAKGREAVGAYLRELDVSRETLARLDSYAERLARWTRRVNLIAPGTRGAIWERHVLDSVQLFPLAPPQPAHWADLGTGGGAPGLVCAIVGQELMPATSFTLVESDRRKAAFLADCIRDLAPAVSLRAERAEALPALGADIVTARALAPLSRLLDLSARHGTPSATFLFPKGARYGEEIEAARHAWRFSITTHPSITDPDARVLRCHVEGRI